jgi:2,4-dienoyl-CoA reductase-like NADH-dependent reductase (Old Yellow Enzyme family)
VTNSGIPAEKIAFAERRLGGLSLRNRLIRAGCFEGMSSDGSTIRDPDFVRHLQRGQVRESDCDHCNHCVAAMDARSVYCVSQELGLIT